MPLSAAAAAAAAAVPRIRWPFESLPGQARFTLCDWALLFSTDQHGCSLRTFYSRTECEGATILIVLDSQGCIFGAFVAESWANRSQSTRSHYFGNGVSREGSERSTF